jgi:hypothetical protein
MELIQSAMRRSQSRESTKSEGTQSRHGHTPKLAINNMGEIDNYDDNYSTPGSDDSIFPQNYEQIKNDPIGKILLDLAHDQTMLFKKCKLENMNVNIHELCDNFEKFMELGELQRQRHSARTQNEMEERLIKKKLSSHLINQAFRPPVFAKTPALTSIGKTSDILKLFPHRNNKFSGNPKDSLSLLEFITSLNAAQEQAQLTEKEFRSMLLACTTGPAHQFLIDWMEDNDEDMASTYHQLALRFDNRMTAEQAKKELFNYKAPRDKTLAQVESHIMSLAHRASTIYQPGEARKQARDLESCDTLIRCLPPASSEMVRKVHGELCTELGRPCSATDLSRALHNFRHSIDADLRAHGAAESRGRQGYSTRPQPRRKINSYSSYGINTAALPLSPPTAPTRNFAQPVRRTSQSSTGQRRFFPPSNNPRPTRGSRRGKIIGSPRRQIQTNGCSLCGQKSHNTHSCMNMRTPSGKIIQVHPVQSTCGLCPGSRKNTLHHPQSLCPFKTNGCLQGK